MPRTGLITAKLFTLASLAALGSEAGNGGRRLERGGGFGEVHPSPSADDLRLDPLAVLDAVPVGELNGSIFLPDLAVGRLVETPQEIITTIATYIGQDGVLDRKLDARLVHGRQRTFRGAALGGDAGAQG